MHRIISSAALTAMVLCIQTAPASASSTLLSGYGGPGQGNQAIIGSTLIGGEGGGSAGGPGAAAPAATTAAPASIALPQVHTRAKARKAAHHRAASTATKPATPKPTSALTGLRRTSAVSSGGGTLGLTGADAVYIILAFCLLAATALLTARLTGRAGRAGGTR